eukprot:TRINITY_DN52922_c0_g1_i1.p1 TRINITY_DN52922_c0_g1~~TRINITY_DN52922_c0_g1_i1.p1  ORF type:complete len:225 (+),score=36.75 TRINITY_DN52922_c0_g1_i1:68-742(+)
MRSNPLHLAVLCAVSWLLPETLVSPWKCATASAPSSRGLWVRRQHRGLPCQAQSASRGFGEAAPRREKKGMRPKQAASAAQLKQDHGKHWQKVNDILKGKKAESPEEMVRARFSAIRSRNADFMGKTEVNAEVESLEQRQYAWKIMLGLESRASGEPPNSLEVALSTLERLEVVGSQGDQIEYKMYCGKNGHVHERAIFKPDEKMGYVYSGKSVFFDLFPAPDT